MINEIKLSDKDYRYIASMIHELCGINLQDGKKELVKSRLSKQLRKLGMKNFSEYIEYVENDSTREELTNLVDAISTNTTSFFREDNHFHFMKNTIIPQWNKDAVNRDIRIWSAACSSGEEPYSIAIVIKEASNKLRSKKVKILATDISTKILSIAEEGMYKDDRLNTVPLELRRKYFLQGKGNLSGYCSVNSDLRQLVTIRRLNLLGEWPMKGKFDLIFCRNVMIYFDKPTQEVLVNKFCDILKPDGFLLIGHAESLTRVKHPFEYLQPTVYRKA